MSLKEKREEAEAVLDSAEMLLETVPRTGSAATSLEAKISELEQELQEPESEARLDKLIDDVRELMDELKDQPMDDPMMGPEEGPMGDEEMGPGDDMPPI